MSYKLLALDLDGTTLRSDYTISTEIVAEIDRIKQQASVILATGRADTAVQPYYHQLDLSTPAICCNGTYLYDFSTKKVSANQGISHEEARLFMKLARAHNIYFEVYLDHYMAYDQQFARQHILDLTNWATQFPLEIRPDIRGVLSLEEALEASQFIWKFVLEGEMEVIEEFLSLPEISASFHGEKSWSNRFDVNKRGNDKGTALKAYCQAQQISASEVVAIGDNHNDLSMLKFAGLSVAMQNADFLVQSAADRVTKATNDQNGILEILKDCF